ncbi:MAG: hypothetical protein KDA44_17385 [Planctomycetales bacterium]|nr:hypothetical protein [Planctomycetales bacterium]
MAHIAPKPSVLGLTPSFGFGDRIGLATPGHLEALRTAGDGIAPIFAQQSIREMTRTGRSAEQVMDDAMSALDAADWKEPHGADADHLKTIEDVDRTAAAGFTFFTIDPSDAVDQQADDYNETTLRERYAAVADQVTWAESYRGRRVKLTSGGTIELTEQAVMRAAVKYGLAVNKAVDLALYIDEVHAALDRPYEIELSIDETEQPTTLAEHFIIAEQCLGRDMKLVSLAPRFIGDFEKGVDYKGDADALEQSLNDHAAIAQLLGPYKISLHSGSDKLSMYGALARATAGQFHVKTAGTSYLEALRVVARHDEALFRRVVDFSRAKYPTDKATYHVSATNESAPPQADVSDPIELEQLYLERWCDVPAGCGFTAPGRQILHCTFGSVLTDPQLGQDVLGVLTSHPDTYAEVLAEHFARHLTSLHGGLVASAAVGS